MKVFKFSPMYVRGYKMGCFFMLEINFLIVDVLDFEDVTTLAMHQNLKIGNLLSRKHVFLFQKFYFQRQHWNFKDLTLILQKGAFKYDVRFLGRQVGQAASDFTKQTYVVKYLIRVGRQVKNTPKPSDAIFEYSPLCKTSYRTPLFNDISIQDVPHYNSHQLYPSGP